MSFQLTFLGYYSIKSPQLKKQTHSVKRRNWSHRERTAPDGRRRRTASGGRGSRPPPSDGLGGRPRPPADGRQRRTSVGSSDAFGRPPDAAVDVRTRDNPMPSTYKVLCLGLWEVRGLGPLDLGEEVLLIFFGKLIRSCL
jgi:hypothetical protein